jgi:hypothetical protein
MNQALIGNQTAAVSSPEFLVEGEDYYLENGLLVMTAAYHKKRGICCGNRCRWCPFEPNHELGAMKLTLDSGISTDGEP